MNFNLVEMYNGLLRFNKHILNELAEGLKHLPNLNPTGWAKPLENGFIPPLDGSDGGFYSHWVRSDSHAYAGFFTTVKLD